MNSLNTVRRVSKPILFIVTLSCFLYFNCDRNPIKYSNDGGFTVIDYHPTWSPDGRTIAYNHGDTSLNLSRIYLIDTNGSNKKQLISGFTNTPDWSHNGFYFVCQFYDWRTGGDSEIAIIYNNGIVKKILTLNNNIDLYPKFSPDDSKVLFTQEAYEGINMQLYSIDADGTNLRRLTDNTQGYTADYSPDDQYIVYCNSSPDDGRLWIMKEDGSFKKQLTH